MAKPWTPADDARLKSLYESYSVLQIAEIMGRSQSSIKNRCVKTGLKKPDGYANTGCFKSGKAPWNKGRSFDSGGRSHETRFKPGQRPHTWNPVGHERVTKDGYRERKISDTGITKQDYVGLHTLLWREFHGDVPEGHAVVFRDGNKENITIGNLECISRAELMRRNSYHNNYPKDVQLLIQLRGAVNRQINKRKDATK